MSNDPTAEASRLAETREGNEIVLKARREERSLVAKVTIFWALSLLMVELLGNYAVTLLMLPYWLAWGVFLCIQLEHIIRPRNCPKCGSEATPMGFPV